MSGKSKQSSIFERVDVLVRDVSKSLPHLFAVLNSEEDFIELKVMARSDGTTLSLCKQYDSGGATVVAFGTGYGVILALMALDSSIQGGNWRIDKPWSPK